MSCHEDLGSTFRRRRKEREIGGSNAGGEKIKDNKNKKGRDVLSVGSNLGIRQGVQPSEDDLRLRGTNS